MNASTAFIGRTMPDVPKAVKWNQPFYGVDGEGWFSPSLRRGPSALAASHADVHV